MTLHSPLTKGSAMTRQPLPAVVRQFAEEALALAALIAEAESVQWAASPVPRPRVDTTERAKGGHSDPVPAIVSDDRRLAVRDAVEEGLQSLRLGTTMLGHARRDVEKALESWAG
jgi:hypothetical protein